MDTYKEVIYKCPDEIYTAVLDDSLNNNMDYTNKNI